jgi:transcriptional/translational regulatory protein YebC/TACO1
LGTSGSVEFMFEHKCHFKIAAGSLDVEEFELEMIDFGAEEIFAEDDFIMLYGPFEAFGNISRGLDEKGLEILESGTEYIPTTTKEVTAEQQADIEKLIEKLEEDDDVQNVYHTMG